MWNALSHDVQQLVLAHAHTPEYAAKLCLVDDTCCVSFVDVVGVWCCGGTRFACNVNCDLVPPRKNEGTLLEACHMEFRVRRRTNGSLVMPSGHDDGKWFKIGKIQQVCVPVSTWHGVSKQTSTLRTYNCLLTTKKLVHPAGDFEGADPQYHFRVLPADRPCIDGSDADRPFSVRFRDFL